MDKAKINAALEELEGVNQCVVLFSGGQDSATALLAALHKAEKVHTIGFNYHQRHSVELEVREDFLRRARELFPDVLGKDLVVDMAGFNQVADSALTRGYDIKTPEGELPNTFAPGRNLLMFGYAMALAHRVDVRILVGGMCETDYSGYPDCRRGFMAHLEITLDHATGMEEWSIVTPLMEVSKAETWGLAHTLGGEDYVSLIVEHTHTCYEGDRSTRHPWGYGCGKCPACELRAKGYAEFRQHVAEVLPV